MATATVTAFKFPTSKDELERMIDESGDDKTPEFFVLLVIEELVDKVSVDIKNIPLTLSVQNLVDVWLQNATPEEVVHMDRSQLAETLLKLPRAYVEMIQEYVTGRLALTFLRVLHGKDAPMPDAINIRLPNVPIHEDDSESDL
ncbi:hypothetical protein HZA87_00775 [Candidatus Uhrbacteria bacterium]|nr:hypothetical protein [Candidatus Uhrbacteria bacterium]